MARERGRNGSRRGNAKAAKRVGEERRREGGQGSCGLHAAARRRWHQCLNSVDSKRKLFQPGGRGRPSWEHGGGQTASLNNGIGAAHFVHMREGSWVRSAPNTNGEVNERAENGCLSSHIRGVSCAEKFRGCHLSRPETAATHLRKEGEDGTG